MTPMRDHLTDSCFYRSPADDIIWESMMKKLPKRIEGVDPCTSGPHSLRAFRAAYEMAGRPAHVLEIGLNLGNSASVFLHFGATVTSIEIDSERQGCRDAVAVLEKKWGRRFEVCWGDSATKINRISQNYDFVYLDGAHDQESVEADIRLALQVNCRCILFDDFYPLWGPGVQPAITNYKLIPLGIFGNLCLTRPIGDWKTIDEKDMR